MKPFYNRVVSLVFGAAIGVILSPATQAQVHGNFDDADANHDGKITLQEFETYATRRLMAGKGRMAQGFRYLSPDDQKARLKKHFDAADIDHNGVLDRKEWSGS